VARFLIDENLPSALARALRTAGHHAEDLRDVRARGSTDDEVFEHARVSRFTLVSRDVGFGNIARFPLGTHSGIVLVRFPNSIPARIVSESVVLAITRLSDDDLAGNLIVVAPGRVRIRRVT
jgi:predicted nuclease of predicted toxin-antitoxin system